MGTCFEEANCAIGLRGYISGVFMKRIKLFFLCSTLLVQSAFVYGEADSSAAYPGRNPIEVHHWNKFKIDEFLDDPSDQIKGRGGLANHLEFYADNFHGNVTLPSFFGRKSFDFSSDSRRSEFGGMLHNGYLSFDQEARELLVFVSYEAYAGGDPFTAYAVLKVNTGTSAKQMLKEGSAIEKRVYSDSASLYLRKSWGEAGEIDSLCEDGDERTIRVWFQQDIYALRSKEVCLKGNRRQTTTLDLYINEDHTRITKIQVARSIDLLQKGGSFSGPDYRDFNVVSEVEETAAVVPTNVK